MPTHNLATLINQNTLEVRGDDSSNKRQDPFLPPSRPSSSRSQHHEQPVPLLSSPGLTPRPPTRSVTAASMTHLKPAAPDRIFSLLPEEERAVSETVRASSPSQKFSSPNDPLTQLTTAQLRHFRSPKGRTDAYVRTASSPTTSRPINPGSASLTYSTALPLP